MNVTLTQSGFIKILIAIAISGLFWLSNEALAATQITTNITTNTTWTTTGSPYVINGNLKTATGTTLTINPGVVVKFAEQSGLRIEGKLLANGTAASRIYFTSIKDDVGGDTNGDGSLTKPAVQDWRTLVFAPGSTGQFNYSTISFAGYFYGMSDVSPAIFNSGGTITISNSEVSSSYLFGIGQTSGSLKISTSTIRKNEHGIAIKGGTVDLIGSTLSANGVGIIDDGDKDLKLTGNTIRDGSQAIMFYPNRQRSIIQTGTIATNNQSNGIVLSGSVKGIFGLSAAKDLPYIVGAVGGSGNGNGPLTFPPNGFEVGTTGTLTFVAGTVVKFESQASLPVYGRLITSGSTNHPVVFTSVYDSTVGGRAVKASLPPAKPGDWGEISLQPKSQVNLNYTILRYGGGTPPNSDSTIFNRGGTLTGNYIQVIDGGQFGIRHVTGTTTIRSSVLSGFYSYALLNESTKPVDARVNYWGDPSGPYHPVTNSKAYGDAVSDYVTFSSPLTTLPTVVPQIPCCSSILFLPGIMGTRLHGTSTKHWEPFGADDIQKLHLNVSGNSIYNIRPGTVIGEFSITTTAGDLNVYKSFLADLDSIKQRGLISNYVAYGYDWRLSLSSVLANKALFNNVKSLANLSKTGKVTIVAHSNGGLLAKALINQLGPDASRVIDEVVLVGVPQLGTPQAVGAMLHGYKSGIPAKFPLLLTEAQSRAFSSTSPAIYNLLPHTDYFNSSGVRIYNPIVTFESGSATSMFTNRYGRDIDTISELHAFLRGDEGRTTPVYTDLASPSKLNSGLLSKSVAEINPVNNSWQPPMGIKVHQIAGVGVPTVSTIYYWTENTKLKYTPWRTVDGDQTVVEPSALAMSTSTKNIRRWWINLQTYNNDQTVDRSHGDIFEIPNLRSLILNNLLATSTIYNYTYLSQIKPNISGELRLSFILHSPLTLSYVASDGSVINESNPTGDGVRFSRYGEVQIIDVYKEGKGEIRLSGEATGSFTLELEEARGDTIISNLKYSNIPSATTTKATLSTLGQHITQTSPLVIDYEGDGITDFSLSPGNTDKVTMEDALFTSPSKQTILDRFHLLQKESKNENEPLTPTSTSTTTESILIEDSPHDE